MQDLEKSQEDARDLSQLMRKPVPVAGGKGVFGLTTHRNSAQLDKFYFPKNELNGWSPSTDPDRSTSLNACRAER